MRFPFDKFKIGTKFGEKGKYWSCGYHSGQDLMSANYGGDGIIHPLYAGRVMKIGKTGAYGNHVYIKHNDGYITLYAHMKQILVTPGMDVTEETALGVEGATGNATGKHLHFEVHKNAYHYPATIDPLEFINSRIQEEKEMQKTIKIMLNGAEKEVTAIEKDGYNYVKLQDLRDNKISVSYDSAKKMPEVSVK
jgi:murein DD-endopeptidase MepM/ murein hydrolase activator NlpD